MPFNNETQKARLPTDSCLNNSKRPSLVNCIPTNPECRSDLRWLVYIQSLVLTPLESALSLSSRVHGLLHKFSPSSASVSVHKISRCILPLLHCCHDPFIVTSALSRPPFTGFTQLAHPSRSSRSTLTTVCFCVLDLPPRVSVLFTRSVIGFITLRLVVECGIHGQ